MNQPNKPPLSGFPLIFVTLGLGLGTFIQVLDTSIANVSIPTISGELGVSPDEGTWVITSFAASNAIVLPLTGWLGLRFGQVRLFVLSVLLFSLASALCGLSTTFPMLVFFRVLQGAVAGSLIPLSQGLLLNSYPEDKKTVALGIWVMVVVVAPVLGPILGGWITDNYGWPWIFYINIPTGIASAAISWSFLRERESKVVKIPTDLMGFILLAITVGTLQVVLDKGKDLDWFSSSVIQTLTLISVLGCIYFVIWTYFNAHPVVDFSFFRIRNYLLGTLLISVGYLIFFGSTVLYPFVLQTVLGYTPFLSGVAIAPVGVFPFFLSILVGKLSRTIDLRWLITFSFVCFFVSLRFFCNLNTDSGMAQFLVPPFILGFAIAFFFIPLTTLSLQGIPQEKLSSASGVQTFIRIFAGGGVGTATFITLIDRRERFYQSRLVEWINPYRETTRDTLQLLQDRLHLSYDSSKAFTQQLVEQQSFMLAMNDIFYAASWLFLLLIPVIWLCRPEPIKNQTILVGE